MMIEFYEPRKGKEVKEMFTHKPFAELLNVAVSLPLQFNCIVYLCISAEIPSTFLQIACHPHDS